MQRHVYGKWACRCCQTRRPGDDDSRGVQRWAGTLLTDRYGACDTVLDGRAFSDRRGAACAAHTRRKFDELVKARSSPLADEAIARLARIYAL